MENQKQIPVYQVLLVLAFLLGTLYYTIMVIEGWIHIPLIFTAAFATIIAVVNGYKWKYIENGIIETISRSMQAVLILMIVGVLIGSWIVAGIVPAMIYYGLQILSPGIFLVATCLICCIVSLATGSSWTTAATVGIALIGVGAGLGIPLPMAAGAIISGAYFGDKMSPLSDTTNLAPAMAGATLFDHVRHMVWTTGPSLIISLVLFGILGARYAGKDMDTAAIDSILTGLSDNFSISPLLIIPPLLVIAMVVFKVPAMPGLLGGVVLGGIFAMIFQGSDMGTLFYAFYEGFTSDLGDEFLNSLLQRGGLSSMYYTVALILCALSFGGVLDSTGMLKTLAVAMLGKAKGTGSLVAATLASCFVTNFVAGDQYLSLVVPGRMFKEMYEDRKLKPKNLSRALEDGGTLTSALVPWNTCGTYMTTVLGVATVAYIPYCFLNIINPFVSLFYGITGISMEKMSEEEYQAVLAAREIKSIVA